MSHAVAELSDPREPEVCVLQFGKAGKDVFILDFGFPLSPLQAFSIALTRFGSAEFLRRASALLPVR